MRKKRKLLEPPLTGSGDRNEMKRPLRRNGGSTSSAESGDMMLGIGWRRKELSGKKNIIMSKGSLGPVLTPLLIPWDGASMNGPRKKDMRVPNGLETYGVPAPWTISS